GIDDGEAGLGKRRRQMGADRVAVGVVGIHDADLLVVLDQVPLRNISLVELFDAFMNQGQICMSTERIILMDEIADGLVGKFRTKAATLVAGNP
ncbi:aldehyde dehydrogenase family protein, partial [Rhizobium johnstonii]